MMWLAVRVGRCRVWLLDAFPGMPSQVKGKCFTHDDI